MYSKEITWNIGKDFVLRINLKKSNIDDLPAWCFILLLGNLHA